MPKLIPTLETSTLSKEDNVNNLSEECIDEIKKILVNNDSRQIRLLIRTINKHINK